MNKTTNLRAIEALENNDYNSSDCYWFGCRRHNHSEYNL